MTEADRIRQNWGLCPKCRNPTRVKVATEPTPDHVTAQPGDLIELHCSRKHRWSVKFARSEAPPHKTIAVFKVFQEGP